MIAGVQGGLHATDLRRMSRIWPTPLGAFATAPQARPPPGSRAALWRGGARLRRPAGTRESSPGCKLLGNGDLWFSEALPPPLPVVAPHPCRTGARLGGERVVAGPPAWSLQSDEPKSRMSPFPFSVPSACPLHPLGRRPLCINPRGMSVIHNGRNGLDVLDWPKRPSCVILKGGGSDTQWTEWGGGRPRARMHALPAT
jgi:hypothetical protein